MFSHLRIPVISGVGPPILILFLSFKKKNPSDFLFQFSGKFPQLDLPNLLLNFYISFYINYSRFNYFKVLAWFLLSRLLLLFHNYSIFSYFLKIALIDFCKFSYVRCTCSVFSGLHFLLFFICFYITDFSQIPGNA